MKTVKKRGAKPATSYLLSGDRAMDEARFRAILLANGLRAKDVARELDISENAVSQYLRLVSRSSRFFRYMESLAKKNNVIVQRAILQ